MPHSIYDAAIPAVLLPPTIPAPPLRPDQELVQLRALVNDLCADVRVLRQHYATLSADYGRLLRSVADLIKRGAS